MHDILPPCDDILPPCDEDMLRKEQEKASAQDKSVWVGRGAVQTEGLWRGPEVRPVLPPGLTQVMLQEAHGPTHSGSRQMKSVDTLVASIFTRND